MILLKQLPLFMLLSFLQSCFNIGGPKLLWQVPIASETPPIVYNGTVYVQGFHAGHPEEAYRIFALDARTGKENWVSVDSVYEMYGASGGYVFFRTKTNHLVQLDAQTGEKIYESTDSSQTILNWVIRGDIMFIVNHLYEVVAVDNRQNKVLWRMELPFALGVQTALQFSGQNVVVSGDYRDSTGMYGLIWALNATTGKEIWHFEAPPPHDFAPLEVLGHESYVLATNTSPLLLQTHVLDANTGKEMYPPIAAFDIYGCYEHTAYASNGNFDLKTGQRKEGKAKWISGSIVHKGLAWQRQLDHPAGMSSFFLRTTYDGDYRGSRNWTDVPPSCSIEGFDVLSGKSVYQTKVCKYTRFSPPVEANGVLFHGSVAMMKEGKSGVWAYRLP